MAKAYVAVIDSGYYQLISHWYNSIKESLGNIISQYFLKMW
jgi:hypothetical protein